MIFLLNVIFVGLVISNYSYAIEVVKKPSLPDFPVENEPYEVICQIYDTLEEGKFIDRNNKVIQDSGDGNRKFTKVTSGTNQTLKLEWKKLRPGDIEVTELICHIDDTGYQYDILPIPAAYVPSLSLSPGNNTSVNKDKSLTLTCSVTLNLASGWTYKLEWVFNGKVIESKKSKYTIAEIPDEAANETSSLTIKNMNSKDEGIYTCQANIHIRTALTTKSKFSKSVDVTVKWDNAKAPGKQEIIRKDQQSVEMVCGIEGYPIPAFSWHKGDNLISASTDKRYSFGNNSQSANSSFKISKVTYKDRSKYYCVATFPSGKVIKQEYILRVRDPLGALWPAIGILIEAVLLFLIIALYSCCKNSRNQNTDKGISTIFSIKLFE